MRQFIFVGRSKQHGLPARNSSDRSHERRNHRSGSDPVDRIDRNVGG